MRIELTLPFGLSRLDFTYHKISVETLIAELIFGFSFVLCLDGHTSPSRFIRIRDLGYPRFKRFHLNSWRRERDSNPHHLSVPQLSGLFGVPVPTSPLFHWLCYKLFTCTLRALDVCSCTTPCVGSVSTAFGPAIFSVTTVMSIMVTTVSALSVTVG